LGVDRVHLEQVDVGQSDLAGNDLGGLRNSHLPLSQYVLDGGAGSTLHGGLTLCLAARGAAVLSSPELATGRATRGGDARSGCRLWSSTWPWLRGGACRHNRCGKPRGCAAWGQ